jgi:hypothetical protein
MRRLLMATSPSYYLSFICAIMNSSNLRPLNDTRDPKCQRVSHQNGDILLDRFGLIISTSWEHLEGTWKVSLAHDRMDYLASVGVDLTLVQ